MLPETVVVYVPVLWSVGMEIALVAWAILFIYGIWRLFTGMAGL